MNLSIRKYIDLDKDSVIQLLRLNTPKFFAWNEEADLIYYLENHAHDFYLLKVGKKLLACGGINFNDAEGIAKISWDIVDPEYQGKGYGSKLLNFRITEIQKLLHIKKITVRTSQLVYPYYERFGFQLIRVEKDYWAIGFDLYQMDKKLDY